MTTTRAQKKEIVEYLLGEVDFDEEEIDLIATNARYDSVDKLLYIVTDQAALSDVAKEAKLAPLQVSILQKLAYWIFEYRSKYNELPVTLDDWKAEFTREIFYAVTTTRNTGASTTTSGTVVQGSHSGGASGTQLPDSSQAAIALQKSIGVKIADYPEFSGRYDVWLTFKSKFESTACMHNRGDVLSMNDVVLHEEKRAADPDYDQRVKEIFHILKMKTVAGTASLRVSKYAKLEDGALAWKNLKDFYDNEGNKDLHRQTCLTDLLAIRYTAATQGGFNRYVNDFEQVVKQIDEAGAHELDESLKKNIFLTGIHDQDFEAIKEVCRCMPYDQMVTALYQKAAELKRVDGPLRGIRHSSNKANMTNKKIGNDRTRFKKQKKRYLKYVSREEGNTQQDGDSGNSTDLYLKSPVWSNMTVPQKQLWVQAVAQKNAGKLPSYGKQYENSANNTKHKAAKTLSQNGVDMEGNTQAYAKANQSPESLTDGIWKPVRKQALVRRLADKAARKAFNYSHSRSRTFKDVTGNVKFRNKTIHVRVFSYTYVKDTPALCVEVNGVAQTVPLKKALERTPDIARLFGILNHLHNLPKWKRAWRDAKAKAYSEVLSKKRKMKMKRRVHESDDASDKAMGAMKNKPWITGYMPNFRIVSIAPVRNEVIVFVKFRDDNQEIPADAPIREYPFEQAKEMWKHALAYYITLHNWECPRTNPIFTWAYDYFDDLHQAREERARDDVNKGRSVRNQVRYVDKAKLLAKTKSDEYEYGFLDSGSDTTGIGGKCWVMDVMTDRTVDIAGYDNKETIRKSVNIGSAITATDLPSGETILLRVNEATILGEDANTLFSTVQMREYGILIDDKARRHGGLSCIIADECVIPLQLKDSMLSIKIRKPTTQELEECEMIDLTSDLPWNPNELSDDDLSKDQYSNLITMCEDLEELRVMNVKKTFRKEPDAELYTKYFMNPGSEVMQKTLQNTTRYGSINLRIPMRQHYKSRNPILSRRRIYEDYATDTWFSTVTSYEGYNCAQIFCGVKSKHVTQFGMSKESDGPNALLEFFRQEGVPISMVRDNSKMQMGKLWTEYCRRFWVKDKFIEPYHSNQNPAERMMSEMKEKLQRIMIDTGCDPEAWFSAAAHVADVHNCTANKVLDYRTPTEVRDGFTPDISSLIQHQFWDLVYFMKYEVDFPTKGGNEGLGRWLGRAQNYGDKMCYRILDVETHAIVIRSMVRPANKIRPNKGLEDLRKDQAKQANPTKKNTFPVIPVTKGRTIIVKDHDEPFRILQHGKPALINPDDLIDIYIYDVYKNRKGGETKMRGKVTERIDDTRYRVSFDNGKQRTYDYEEIINMANRPDEDDEERWIFEKIISHRWSPTSTGKIDVLVKWEGYEEPSWEPMEIMKKDDPVTLAKYAEENHLLNKSAWKWANRYVKNKKKVIRISRLMASKRKTGTKYQFGYRVPRTISEAYKLDEINGNTKWADAIKKEVDLLYHEYSCFKLHEKGEKPPADYQKIPLLWVFAVKYDGRHRARCVAGGHVTPDLQEDLYSGVVDLQSVRIALVAASLMKLKVVTADIASAYIKAYTNEKVYVQAGREFGDIEGRDMTIIKALYGLKSSGAMFHKKLSDDLLSMGFTPSYAHYDLWMRQCANDDKSEFWYEYVAVIVDDLLIFSRDPETFIHVLRTKFDYELKGVGVPEYYSGADLSYEQDTNCWVMSAKTYIKNVTERIEKLLETELKCYGSPLDAGDHPEMDDTDYLYGSDISMYQMLIGCAQWAVTLGRFDVQYATNTLARYAIQPREGHFKRCLRLFGYLKYHSKARLRFDPSDPNYDGLKFDNQDWANLYPGAEEILPNNMPPPATRPIDITVYVDASHATDMETRRSVSGYIILLGQSPVAWYSKRQNTIESSSYGSELVAMRIAVEALLAMRYQLRMLGIAFNPTSTILCDNEGVIMNTQRPSSNLKKKHNAVAYHRTREAISIGVARTAHVSTTVNLSDILTTPKGPAVYYQLLSYPLYGRYPTP